jgi:hypothetical protein
MKFALCSPRGGDRVDFGARKTSVEGLGKARQSLARHCAPIPRAKDRSLVARFDRCPLLRELTRERFSARKWQHLRLPNPFLHPCRDAILYTPGCMVHGGSMLYDDSGGAECRFERLLTNLFLPETESRVLRSMRRLLMLLRKPRRRRLS